MKLKQLLSLSLVLFSFLTFPSFAKSLQEARNVLAQLKITYSVDEFFKCAEDCNTSAVILFLDAGMSPNAKDKHGWTVLMYAAYKGHKEIAQILVNNKADVNAKTKTGVTALIMAAVDGNAEIVRALLNKGADVNAKDNRGFTALIEAAKCGHTGTVQALLHKGADVNVKDNKGKTALMKALRGNDPTIVSLLKDAGAKE